MSRVVRTFVVSSVIVGLGVGYVLRKRTVHRETRRMNAFSSMVAECNTNMTNGLQPGVKVELLSAEHQARFTLRELYEDCGNHRFLDELHELGTYDYHDTRCKGWISCAILDLKFPSEAKALKKESMQVGWGKADAYRIHLRDVKHPGEIP
jgi:hypothetical protein